MTYLDRVDTYIASLGVEAYRVGGSVRDELLGRRVKDADYMVRGVSLVGLGARLGAKGDGAKITPLKLRDGRQVGYRVARQGLGLIEIALPRTEVSTGPGRHDFEIVTNPLLTLEQDAVRRDFTFNALYKIVAHPDNLRASTTLRDGTPVQDILDPTGRGLYDLQHRLVNTTHADSFRDDPLRTLRALRFVSTLGYDLGTQTHIQMARHSDAVTGLTRKGVSGTALDELQKLLMGADVAKALRLARDTNVLQTLLPELAPMCGFEQGSKYHDLTTDEHTFKALEVAAHVDAPLRVRMALLFHDAGKPETAWRGEDGRLHYYSKRFEYSAPTKSDKAVVVTEDHEVVGVRLWLEASARLNVPRRLRQDVAHLIAHHMVTVVGRVKPSKVRRERVRHGDDMLRDLYLHRLCDVSGKGKPDKNYIQQLAALERIRQEAAAAGIPCDPKDLEIDGHDVEYLGASGRQIGEILRTVLDEVVVDPSELKLSRQWQWDRATTLIDAGVPV